jgi:hypothetical protein
MTIWIHLGLAPVPRDRARKCERNKNSVSIVHFASSTKAQSSVFLERRAMAHKDNTKNAENAAKADLAPEPETVVAPKILTPEEKAGNFTGAIQTWPPFTYKA